MQTEIYRVTFIVSGTQYATSDYGLYMWKDHKRRHIADISSLSEKERKDLLTKSFSKKQDIYVSIRSDDALEDIKGAITKYYDYVMDVKIKFTVISLLHEVSFIIDDGECRECMALEPVY